MRLIFLSLFLMATSPVSSATEPFTVTIPGQGWTVAFESPPLMNFQGQTKGKDFHFLGIGEAGFNVSMFVEEPKNLVAGHEACFEHYWPLSKRNPMIDQASVKIDKTEKFVKVSYLINVGKVGKAVGETRSTNVNYYFEFQNRWIDLHASLFPAAKDDDELLAALEQSLSYQALKENLKKP